MKLRNDSKREIAVKFLALDSGIDPKDRDRSGPGQVVIAPDQVAEVPDVQWDLLRDRKPYKGHLEKKRLIELGTGLRIIPGDGDPECEICYGRGFVSLDGRTGNRCRCVLKRDVIANVRRIWPGYDLMKAAVLKKPSRLREFTERNVWITANLDTFKAHLRHVAIRQGPYWFARVRSDTDMMTGWFASAKAKSIEIFDADVSESVAKDMDIQDLSEPPDLLIMRLGVKRARNVATPEVLMEILAIREHLDKPTWVVDQPTYCIEDDVHRCNSPEVLGLLQESYARMSISSLSGTKDYEMPEGVIDVGPSQGSATSTDAPKANPFQKEMTGKTTPDSAGINVSEDD